MDIVAPSLENQQETLHVTPALLNHNLSHIGVGWWLSLSCVIQVLNLNNCRQPSESVMKTKWLEIYKLI